jgi:hypothetical protein
LKTINHSKDFLKGLDFQLKIIFNISILKWSKNIKKKY